MNLIYIPFLIAILDLLFVLYLIYRLKQVSSGQVEIQTIAKAIREGAVAFLRREFKTMALIFVLIAIGLFLLYNSISPALIFLAGALTSSLAGYVGMIFSHVAPHTI